MRVGHSCWIFLSCTLLLNSQVHSGSNSKSDPNHRVTFLKNVLLNEQNQGLEDPRRCTYDSPESILSAFGRKGILPGDVQKNTSQRRNPDVMRSVAPSNDLCVNALPLTTGILQGMTCSALRDGSTTCTIDDDAPDLWFRYTATFDGNLVIDTLGSNFDTVLSVHTGCPGNELNQIACNDDCGNPASCLSLPVVSGQDYWIRVSGFRSEMGAFTLNLTPESSIAGRITDAQTHTPLADVFVLLYTPKGDFVRSAQTDHSGHYLISGLGSGNYIARTYNAAAYIDELYDDHICEGFTCVPEDATLIYVPPGVNSTRVDFALDRGGTVSGNVSDADTGAPLEHVEVHIHDLSNNHISIGFSDAAGNFTSFDGLPAGDYLVFAFNNQGYVDELYRDIPCVRGFCNLAAGQHVHVQPGSNTSGIDFPLSTGGDITGTVTDALSGLPVSGVQLRVFDSNGILISTGSSGDTGDYSVFDGLPSGTYFVGTLNGKIYADEVYDNVPCTAGVCNVQTGKPVNVVAGQVTSHINFALRAGGFITGNISNSAGDPLSGILIDLHDDQDRHLKFEFTDQNGNYTSYYGLHSGNYFIQTANFDGYLDELYDNLPCVGSLCTSTSGTPIAITLGTTKSGINFVLNKGGTASGKVTGSTTGLPLARIIVPFFDAGTGDFLTLGFSDSCGRYSTFGGLFSGKYLARTFNNAGLLDKIFDDYLCFFNGCNPFTGTRIPLGFGLNTPRIDFSLGSLLLLDDFGDGVLAWDVIEGDWKEIAGTLTGSPKADQRKAVVRAKTPWNPSGASACSLCTIELKVRTTGGPGSKIYLEGWFQDSANKVEVSLNESTDKWKLRQYKNRTLVVSAGKRKAIDPNVTYSVKLRYEAGHLKLYVDQALLIDIPTQTAPSGNIQIRVKQTTGTFDDLLIY